MERERLRIWLRQILNLSRPRRAMLSVHWPPRGAPRGLALGAALLLAGLAGAPPAAAPAPAPAAPAQGSSPAAGGAGAPVVAPQPTAASAPQTPATVTAGIVARNAYFWPVWIAQAVGLFNQQAIQNEVILTRSPAGGHQMLVNGGADVALSTPETAIIAASKGAPLVLIAGGQEDPAYSLIV